MVALPGTRVVSGGAAPAPAYPERPFTAAPLPRAAGSRVLGDDAENGVARAG